MRKAQTESPVRQSFSWQPKNNLLGLCQQLTNFNALLWYSQRIVTEGDGVDEVYSCPPYIDTSFSNNRLVLPWLFPHLSHLMHQFSTAWCQILALPLHNCVTVHDLLNLFLYQFLPPPP